jgi:hypothetical protein
LIQFNTRGFAQPAPSRFEALLANDEFQSASSFRDQIDVACISLRAFENGSQLSFRDMGWFLNNECASFVKSQCVKSQQQSKAVGRPDIFTHIASPMIKERLSLPNGDDENHEMPV